MITCRHYDSRYNRYCGEPACMVYKPKGRVSLGDLIRCPTHAYPKTFGNSDTWERLTVEEYELLRIKEVL